MKTKLETIKELLGKAGWRASEIGLSRFILLLLLSVTTATAWAEDHLKSYIDVCKGGIGEVCITGCVYDTDMTDYETAEHYGISVRAVVSTAPDNSYDNYDEAESITMEYVERPDVNSTFGLTGKHGFTSKVFVYPHWFEDNSEMTVYVRIYAKVYTNHEEVLLKSTSTTVRMGYGYGTEESPYVIFNAADWDLMADPVLAPFYADSYIRLANVADDGDDYDNSTAATKAFGTSASPFAGHFDGKGQTLNVNISGTGQHVAPFAYVNGASIHDLTVSGSISGSQYAGGIVGHAAGSLTMKSCLCSTAISSFAIFAGGLVGWCDDLTLNMQNCLFKGSFSPGNGGQYQPIASKESVAVVEENLLDVYYLNTSAPSEGMSDCAFYAVEGIPVNTTYVDGEWDKPVRLIDGQTYYAPHTIVKKDRWNAKTRTLTVYSNPGTKYRRKTDIEHLIIGNTVTDIEEEAFYECVNIKTVTFEQNSHLERIGHVAFISCEALTEITIPASVRTIDDSAFELCYGLRSFTAAEGSQLEAMDEYVFAYCEDLTSVAFLGVTPPDVTASTFAPGLNTDRLKFYVRSAEYKQGDFWGGYTMRGNG